MASPNSYPTIQCKSWERPWRTYCVDRSLEDEWLERLNDLSSFDLISICEGHTESGANERRRLPHFNLRLKDDRLEHLIENWLVYRVPIGASLDRSFDNKYTRADLEVRSGFVKERGVLSQKGIVLLKISAFVDVLDFDPAYYEQQWFDNNIRAAENFDRDTSKILNCFEPSPKQEAT